MKSASGFVPSLILLLVLAVMIGFNEASSLSRENGSSPMESKSKEMVPLMEEKMVILVNETRRKLNSFSICGVCTCCGVGAKGLYCLPSPCCFAINCNIPNRPFGLCSFTPTSCNCFGCHY